MLVHRTNQMRIVCLHLSDETLKSSMSTLRQSMGRAVTEDGVLPVYRSCVQHTRRKHQEAHLPPVVLCVFRHPSRCCFCRGRCPARHLCLRQKSNIFIAHQDAVRGPRNRIANPYTKGSRHIPLVCHDTPQKTMYTASERGEKKKTSHSKQSSDAKASHRQAATTRGGRHLPPPAS